MLTSLEGEAPPIMSSQETADSTYLHPSRIPFQEGNAYGEWGVTDRIVCTCCEAERLRKLIINLEARLAFVEFALKGTLEVAIEDWQPNPGQSGCHRGPTSWPRERSPEF